LILPREPASEVPLLIQEVQKAVGLPLIIAGSINSYERIEKMKELGVWTFTIGGAIQDLVGRFKTVFLSQAVQSKKI